MVCPTTPPPDGGMVCPTTTPRRAAMRGARGQSQTETRRDPWAEYLSADPPKVLLASSWLVLSVWNGALLLSCARVARPSWPGPAPHSCVLPPAAPPLYTPRSASE